MIVGIPKNYLQQLRSEFTGYNASKLGKDLMAGITVAAVALPLALAFGVSSGATAAAGLVTAIIAGSVIGALSGASYQISGPTGAMSAILISLVAQHGLQGVFAACLISGILLLLAGVFKLGDLISFIPMPVITGFTSGIAVIIALGQIDNLTGLSAQATGALPGVLSYFTSPQSIDPVALVVGVATIALMAIYPKKWSKYCPGSLCAIVLATAANMIFSLPLQRVGDIPRTLLLADRLDITSLNPQMLSSLIAPGISIAALGLIESLLCGSSAGRMKGERLNARQELIAQGIGNILLPFLGGVPATAAIARTSVAIKSGGQTRLTSVFHAGVLLLSMFALGGIMSSIPLAALAGVLIVTAWRMNEWHTIRDIFGKKVKSAIWQFVITMAATVVFDLTIAIVIGVLFSVLLFMVKISNLQVSISDIDPDKFPAENAHSEPLRQSAVAYLVGPLYFGTAHRLEKELLDLSGKRYVVISMRGVSLADYSGICALKEACEQLAAQGIEVHFAGVQENVMRRFEQYGLDHTVGKERFHWSADRALAKIAG